MPLSEAAKKYQNRHRERILVLRRRSMDSPLPKRNCRERAGKWVKKNNAELIVAAKSHRQPWTADQNATLLRTDLTASQAATLTGRSYHAVKHQRQKLVARLHLPGPIVPPHARKSREWPVSE
jgi:hypothetical protein